MLENGRKPEWFRENIRRLAVGETASQVLRIIRENDLNTVCTSAACPNKGVCFAEGTATFMILGDSCTRACRFCNVSTGRPQGKNLDEALRVADAAKELQLRFVVITSVCRALKERIPGARVEVLTPDFSGRDDCLKTVLDARPDVFNHNLETVRRLTPSLRTKASYDRSLGVLARARALAPAIPTKSGLMAGLGETREELREAFNDLARAGIARLTIGQYLQPSRRHHPVAKYYTPEEFEELRIEAKSAGICAVLSGPLVRSSYHAGKFA